MRLILLFLLFVTGTVSFAQVDTVTIKTPVTQSFQPQSRDHFMIQLGALTWQNSPDSVRTAGLPRTFNMYVLLDFPFKTNPHFSVAIGPGVATDHMFLDATNVGIRGTSPTIRFQNVSDTSHFKKYKLSTAYAEAPIELRYNFNAQDEAKSVKIALGAKVGALLSAWVKGKDLQDSKGNTIAAYTMKEKSKKYFNSTRISLTGRAGWGRFSAFASYALTPLFKEGNGPKVQPMSIGLTISGL